MAKPEALVLVVDHPRFTAATAFELATWISLVTFAVLSLRGVVLLVRAGRRLTGSVASFATQGTVMAEFALVLPVVLLLIGTVIQIALIAQAAVVVRYAAFTAARSAMVNFEADTNTDLTSSGGQGLLAALQVPPFPEWVDPASPERAACMVLASLSPRASTPDAEGRQMDRLLRAQGAAWAHGDFPRRLAYARAATRVTTIRRRHRGGLGGDAAAWHDSFTPLIPLPENAVQPARQLQNEGEIGYLLPEPPPVASILPDRIPIRIPIPIPEPFDAVIDPITISFDIPLPVEMIEPLTEQLDAGIDVLRTGSAVAIRGFARSPFNIDPVSPKEVEITLVYDFELAVPSLLQLAPGVTRPAADGSGRAFRLQHSDYFTVRLQSTGGRRTLLGLFPVVPDIVGREWVPNTPLYWRSREKEDEGEQKEDGSKEDEKKDKDKKDKDKKKMEKEGDEG